jgi:putative transposase
VGTDPVRPAATQVAITPDVALAPARDHHGSLRCYPTYSLHRKTFHCAQPGGPQPCRPGRNWPNGLDWCAKTLGIWYILGVQRTVRLELHPAPEQTESLADTSRQFTESFNSVCCHGWQERETNGVTLHHATYRTLKDALPSLVSDLHIQARVKATEAVKSALALAKKGKKVSCPQSRFCAPRFNLHTFKLSWEQRTVRLSTTKGRVTVPFSLPEYAKKYLGNPTATADLLFRKGRWWLNVVLTLPTPDIEACAHARTQGAPAPAGSEEVIGIDLGLTRAAVTSANGFYGERRWRELEARDFRLRRALQQKGTKSAKRHLKKLSGRTARRRRDHDHVVSRRIVDATPPGATLAVENLTDIRQRVKARKANGGQRRLHSWSFASLRAFLTYKGEEVGIQVEGIDPRHTSQTCSHCGFQHRSNRRSPSWFRCRSCDYQSNADRNGALNIAAKLLASRATCVAGGSLSEDLSCQSSLPSNGVCCGLDASSQALAGGI